MGKCKGKDKPHKVNPTGLLSLRDMNDDDISMDVNEPIQNIIVRNFRNLCLKILN